MFPLTSKILIRGARAHELAGLGVAADYVADYVDLFSPFEGTLRSYSGVQGGLWLELTRPTGERLKMAHLSRYIVSSGKVKEGQLIAITGNTGTITTGPHLHLECYNNQGIRLDPEKYQWYNTDMTCQEELIEAKKEIIKLNTEIGKTIVDRDEWQQKAEYNYAEWQKCLDKPNDCTDLQAKIDRAKADLA